MSENIENLLSDYYGIDQGRDGSADELVESFDLNSTQFDSDLFIQKIIGEQNLKELVLFDNEMFGDVKSLDSEQQMLVYENYNKFISATDTISDMKTHLNSMNAEMLSLSHHMQKVRSLSESVDSHFGSMRSRLHKLVHVRRVLQRLHFLLHLPRRLTDAIENNRLEDAVRYFEAASPVLAASNGIKSFSRLQQEIDAAMTQLRRKLHQRARDGNLDVQQQMLNVGLLLQLGEDRDRLWPDVLESRRTYLFGQLKDITSAVASRMEADLASSIPLHVSSELFMSEFSSRFADSFLKFAHQFDKLFMRQSVPTHSLSSNVKISQASLSDQESVSAMSQMQTAMVSLTRELYTEFFSSARKLLLAVVNQDHFGRSKEASMQFLLELHHLHEQCVTGVNDILPQANLADRSADLIEHCLRQSVENVFQQGRSAALNVIQEWHQCYVGSADHQANLERISKFDSQLSLHLAALSQIDSGEKWRRVRSLLVAIFQQCIIRLAPLGGSRSAATVTSSLHSSSSTSSSVSSSTVSSPEFINQWHSAASLIDRLDLSLPVSDWVSSQLDQSVRFMLHCLRGRLVPEPHHVFTSSSSFATPETFSGNSDFLGTGNQNGRIILVREPSAVLADWFDRMDYSNTAMANSVMFYLHAAQFVHVLAQDTLSSAIRFLHQHFPLASLHSLGALEFTVCHHECSVTQRLLLAQYLDQQCLVIQRLVDGWLCTDYPNPENAPQDQLGRSAHQISPPMKAILQFLKDRQQELADVLNTSSRSAQSFKSKSSASFRPDRSSVKAGIDRLFSRRIDLRSPITCDQQACMAYFVKHTLKNVSESLRLCAVDNSSLIQLEFDLRCLRDSEPVSSSCEHCDDVLESIESLMRLCAIDNRSII